MRIVVYFSFFLIFISPSLISAEENKASFPSEISRMLIYDQKSFYSKNNMLNIFAGLGVSGIIAHSSIDENFQRKVQNNYINNDTENISDYSKLTGEGRITIPLYICLYGIGELTKENRTNNYITDWGKNSLRAVMTGAPPLLLLQRAIGSSRPNDNNSSSWKSFEDSNGLGGHSFMGAVPFMTAGEMTDSIFLKSFFYAGSLIPSYSRIHDNAHYLSQTMMGWWLAFICVKSINNPSPENKYQISPMMINDGFGISVAMEW